MKRARARLFERECIPLRRDPGNMSNSCVRFYCEFASYTVGVMQKTVVLWSLKPHLNRKPERHESAAETGIRRSTSVTARICLIRRVCDSPLVIVANTRRPSALTSWPAQKQVCCDGDERPFNYYCNVALRARLGFAPVDSLPLLRWWCFIVMNARTVGRKKRATQGIFSYRRWRNARFFEWITLSFVLHRSR